MTSNNTVDNEASSLIKRLQIKKKENFGAAMRGEQLPYAMGLRLTRFCIVRGIRYHHGFAQELFGIDEVFTRALNARSIMSNIIPEMKTDRPEEFPYCIWHPEVASEDTYRKLAQRYPQMAYQVGRACAVAGYTDLFLELNLLPEVHIAEEARESGNHDIFNAIMAKPVKYAIMDDYIRSVDSENPLPASLNGDTAVLRILEQKQEISPLSLMNGDNDDDDEELDFLYNPGFHKSIFNITEDMNVAEDVEFYVYGDYPPTPGTYDVTPLLYTPLPVDLPTVDKDMLILMAAYYGNIERYTRLRRPMMISQELKCVVHGIYHNTMFAKWWSLQDLDIDERGKIESAIGARFIMNNDISWVTDPSHKFSPYMIWYPTFAASSTYRELARRKPDMKPQILRAAIVAGYEKLFDELVNDVEPDQGLLREAQCSGTQVFAEALKKRAVDLGLALNDNCYPATWKMYSIRGNPIVPTVHLNDTPWPDTTWPWVYDGIGVDTTGLEVFVSIPPEIRPPNVATALDYVEWPRKDAV